MNETLVEKVMVEFMGRNLQPEQLDEARTALVGISDLMWLYRANGKLQFGMLKEQQEALERLGINALVMGLDWLGYKNGDYVPVGADLCQQQPPLKTVRLMLEEGKDVESYAVLTCYVLGDGGYDAIEDRIKGLSQALSKYGFELRLDRLV